jgi:hypothetical protein
MPFPSPGILALRAVIKTNPQVVSVSEVRYFRYVTIQNARRHVAGAKSLTSYRHHNVA